MPWLRNRRRLVPLLLLLLIVAGGLMLSESNHRHPGMPSPGSLAPQTSVISDASAVTVEIVNFDFFPRELTVLTGAKVTWTNRDVAPHDATEEADGWSTGMLRQGDSGTLAFDSAGAYRYLCTIHPTMRATLRVSDRAAGGEKVTSFVPRADVNMARDRRPKHG